MNPRAFEVPLLRLIPFIPGIYSEPQRTEEFSGNPACNPMKAEYLLKEAWIIGGGEEVTSIFNQCQKVVSLPNTT